MEDGRLPVQTHAELEYMLKEMIKKKVPATLVLLDYPEPCLSIEIKEKSPPGDDGNGAPVDRMIIPCHVFKLKLTLPKSEKQNIWYLSNILAATSLVMRFLSGEQLSEEDVASTWSCPYYEDAKYFYDAYGLKEKPAKVIAITLNYDERRELLTTSLHLYAFI